MNAESFATYLALDLFNTANYNPDRLTLGVSVWDFKIAKLMPITALLLSIVTLHKL